MDTFKVPTVSNLYDTIINDYTTRTGQVPPLLQRAAIKVMGWALAGIVILLWRFGSWQYLQVFVETAALPALKKWGSLIGLDYNEGEITYIRTSRNKLSRFKQIARSR